MSTASRVFVVGIGMTKFEKPGKYTMNTAKGYINIGTEAARKAMKDAKISYESIQRAVTGFVYGESCSGMRVCYEIGMKGIPIYNINSNCSTGSMSMSLARDMIRGGLSDCVLAIGFETMKPGSIAWGNDPIRESPMQMFFDKVVQNSGMVDLSSSVPANPFMFSQVAKEHMKSYGSKPEHFAMIAEKNHLHSVNNPYAQFQKKYTLKEILDSPMISDPLTKLQCSPTSDGAASAVLCSERFVKENNLQNQAIEIVACEVRTDSELSLTTSANAVGKSMTRAASQAAYEAAKISPKDINVIELHDCFSANELITYEALGLCKEGEGHKFVDSGAGRYGSKVVINPSGGLISKGHPLGATGLAQCAEICWQLRNQADKRQVRGAELGMAHNLGMGGSVVVTIFKRAEL